MRLVFVILCILSYATASGQTQEKARASLCIDLAAIITERNVRFGFSHSFSERWSAEGKASIRFIRHETEMTEEDRHEEMLEGKEESGEIPDENLYPEFRIGFRFWPGRYCSGAYVAVYCLHDLKYGTDMTIGCGYAFKVWKCLGITAGYELDIRKCITGGRFSTDGISLGINYIF